VVKIRTSIHIVQLNDASLSTRKQIACVSYIMAFKKKGLYLKNWMEGIDSRRGDRQVLGKEL
jgi:hypothetical protein